MDIVYLPTYVRVYSSYNADIVDWWTEYEREAIARCRTGGKVGEAGTVLGRCGPRAHGPCSVQ